MPKKLLIVRFFNLSNHLNYSNLENDSIYNLLLNDNFVYFAFTLKNIICSVYLFDLLFNSTSTPCKLFNAKIWLNQIMTGGFSVES